MAIGLSLVGCRAQGPRDGGPSAAAARGKVLYNIHCADCHGVKGDGGGPVAPLLWPKPRDLTSGIFKYRTTRGPVPSDTDILQTMKVGVPGTAMPGWDLLSMAEWKDLLAYVKSFAPRIALAAADRPVDIPTEVKSTPELIAKGRGLFAKRGCVACHGAAGNGDGPAAASLTDAWGDRVAPRDLTRGPLKWGNMPRDIYRTIIMGIPGTPMPAYEHSFTTDELWALTHFVKSLQAPLPEGYDPANPKKTVLDAAKIAGELPLDYHAPIWGNVQATPVFLKPLWHESGMTEWLTAKALHNGSEIAIYLRWTDNEMNVEGARVDGVAVQFPIEKVATPADLPYLGMGHAGRPVAIWAWHVGRTQELTARGMNAVRPKSPEMTRVMAKGTYDAGEWHVIMKREIAAAGRDDATIQLQGYCSFALWDGDLPKHAGPESFSEWMIYELAQ
ncbi:MAG: c-type cytochrome [Deltaproteobacteria bacterium]|nr:c-type cytochrome [Deltaproteobacteria bacterium]